MLQIIKYLVIFIAILMPCDCSIGIKFEPMTNIICQPDEIRCKTHKYCINLVWMCDGQSDCEDFSDEMNCKKPTASCLSDEFYCIMSDTCIPISAKCDGKEDCDDGYDEIDCYTYTNVSCDTNWFNCPGTNKCSPVRYICDHEIDCPDGFDEKSCVFPEPCNNSTQFRCDNGACIKDRDVCNGESDCWDGSDEVNCTKANCSGFWCESTLKCLPEVKRCNLQYDCENKEDEYSCPLVAKWSNNSEHITAKIGTSAKWTFKITNNTEYWTIIWKNPKGSLIGSETDKHEISLIRRSPFRYELELKVFDVSWEDDGYYPVQFNIYSGFFPIMQTKLLYLEVAKPTISDSPFTNLQNSTLEFTSGTPLALVCNVTEGSKTKVLWSWENKPILDWPTALKYKVYENSKILLLLSVPEQTPGRFMCIAENAKGKVAGFADVVVVNSGTTSKLSLTV